MNHQKYQRLHQKIIPFPASTIRSISSSYNKAFHAKLHTLFASSESEIYTFAQESAVHYDFCFCFMKDDQGQWYIGNDQIERVRRWVLKQAKGGTSNIKKLYQQWEYHWKEFTALATKLNTISLRNYSNKEVYELFEKFHDHYVQAGSIAYIADSFMSTGSEDWLEVLLLEELTKRGLPTTKKVPQVRILTSPVHLSFTLEAEYQLLKVARLVEKKYGLNIPSFSTIRKCLQIMEKLQKLEDTFYWIQNNYYNTHYITKEEFYEEVYKVLQEVIQNKIPLTRQLRKKEDELEHLQKERQELITKLSLSPFTKNLLEITRLFSKWKDVRKSGVYIGMHHYDRFLEEVSHRTNYTKRQLTFVVFDEIKEILLNGEKMDEEIAQREKQCFFAVTPKGYFIVSGEKANSYFKSIAAEKNQSAVELRGVIACTGYARGRVRIIRKTQEMKLFQEGEILVTNQTTPEFLPIMKKAAAIVTEQGGITSHAAIISRELGKPCIIGTKIATSALMNGEMVEVDANNGIIRRER